LPLCRKRKQLNQTSLGVPFSELPFRVQSVLCALADLIRFGGVYMDHDTVLDSPLTLYLGGEQLVVGASLRRDVTRRRLVRGGRRR
jgi:hypothetical protein